MRTSQRPPRFGRKALVLALEDEVARGAPSPGAMVFGALVDKAWPEMLEVLAGIPCPRLYVAPRGRLAADPAQLAKRAPGQLCGSLEEALIAARDAAGDLASPVLVCGSLYLVGEARALLLGLASDPPVAM